MSCCMNSPAGAGSERRREGGGFLRANAAFRFKRDRHLFPPGSALHLPEPADSTSPPPQDRCCLNHWLRRVHTTSLTFQTRLSQQTGIWVLLQMATPLTLLSRRESCSSWSCSERPADLWAQDYWCWLLFSEVTVRPRGKTDSHLWTDTAHVPHTFKDFITHHRADTAVCLLLVSVVTFLA